MRRRKPQFKRRRYKASSTRRLSSSDLTVLDFLWTWKVATTPILREVAYKRKSAWWIYKSLRRLRVEKYIELLPRGKNLEQELWTLTDHGFEIVLMDRDDIKEYRYRVHAPAHDYLGTCLQLGDLWQLNVEKKFLTEQMLTSLAPSNFPKGYRPEDGDHIPDGLTILPGNINQAVIGYEVDLNLKDPSRYRSTAQYYKYDVGASLVVWLVKNMWIANKIIEQLAEYSHGGDVNPVLARFAFILVDDFKQRVWGAEVVTNDNNSGGIGAIGGVLAVVVLFGVLMKILHGVFIQLTKTFNAFTGVVSSFFGSLWSIAEMAILYSLIVGSVIAAIYFTYKYILLGTSSDQPVRICSSL